MHKRTLGAALAASFCLAGCALWLSDAPAKVAGNLRLQAVAHATTGHQHDEGCTISAAEEREHLARLSNPVYREAYTRYTENGMPQNIASKEVWVLSDPSNPQSKRVKKPLGEVAMCFAEDTPREVVQAFMYAMSQVPDGAWERPGDETEYQLNTRWAGGGAGDPEGITWSFMPDGTNIPSAGYAGEPNGNSELFSNLDNRFSAQGGRAAWIALFQQVFDRWEYLTGINFTRVQWLGLPWDDGAAFGTAGAAGLRGDMRIGMKEIDNASSILAYCYYPQNGDMVLDRDENWGSSTNNFRFMRNIVQHEAGHGVGLRHVCSSDSGQLMEPFLNTSFDNVQMDDTRGGARHYGDTFEPNNTTATAMNQGDQTWPDNVTYGFDYDEGNTNVSRRAISVDGDQDYIEFNVTKRTEVDLILRPIGDTYDDSSQAASGACNSGNPVNALAQADLELQLLNSGGVVIASSTAAGAGANEQILNFEIPTGSYFIRVFEQGTPVESQLYTLEHVSSTANDAPTVSAIANATINENVLWSVDASASDPDGDALTFSLVGAPAGMTINSSTGVVSWTPSESQGPGVYNFSVRATDNGDPNLSDTEAVTLTVNEVNSAPVILAISDKVVNEQVLFSYDAAALDSDIPGNTQTWSLTAAPAGMSINSVTGVISWTPTEAQGPGVYGVTVRVFDGAAADLESFNITVNEVNKAPVLAAIGSKSVVETNLLTFDANATDEDLPANTLTYSLIGAPAGASINSATGVFQWTPTEAQGPNVYNVTVRVTDNGSGLLFDQEVVQITVKELNTAPTLAAITDKNVNEGSLLSFATSASDTDVPANTLSYTLPIRPAGMTISAAGVISWTPTEAQGPGVYNVTARVTDNGDPALFAERSFKVTVAEINQAPVLQLIGNKSVVEETLLTFDVNATDPDFPANTLSYGLIGAPAGMTIDSVTGVVNWTPTIAQGPNVYNVTIIVLDNGLPQLSDTEAIQVKVFESAKLLKGTINLLDFVGDPSTVPVTIEIRNAGSSIVRQTEVVSINGGGEFSLPIDPSIAAGTYDVTAKASHWLRNIHSSVVISGSGGVMSTSLLNGDVDDDNVVTVFDYARLSDAFDTIPGDPAWDPEADLDGDGAVTVFDYAILSNNFDVSGVD